MKPPIKRPADLRPSAGPAEAYARPTPRVSRRPDQTTRTVTDAVLIVEVLSDDTAATDGALKPRDYAEVPSPRAYVLLEQTELVPQTWTGR